MTETGYVQDVVALGGHEQAYGLPTSDADVEPAGRFHVGTIMPWAGAVNAKDLSGSATNQVQVYSGSYIGKTVGLVQQPALSPNIPDGWLICDGSVYLRAEYPDLHALIYDDQPEWLLSDGTDADRFAIPDLQMRVPIGAGIYRALGESEAITTVASRALLHVHGVSGTHDHASGSLAFQDYTHGSASNTPTTGVANKLKTPLTHGAGGDHNVIGTSGSRSPGTTDATTQATLWPYLMVNFIIKAVA